MKNLPPKIIVFYDRAYRVWTATYQDVYGDQIGDAGHGHTKADAIAQVQYLRMLNCADEN